MSDPFLTAVALINAQQRHDGRAVQLILDESETRNLAMVLAQMTATAIRSAPMTIAEFSEMQIDKTLDSAKGDR
jgi:hypothetical protein